MIVCINTTCQAHNPDGSHFCGRCGTHLPLKKPGPHLEATQFCRACGTRRERYPNDRRMCTILFADVHGFTAMSETLNDVEKVTEIMNMVFTRLTEKIVDLGGSIDKYAGDNIMARFGAPEAHEDDPERALRAALEMQAELKKISAGLQERYGFALAMRIGLNTGEVNAAEVGGEVRGINYKTYTVMGDTVNLASRLEHEARIGHVLVGELTYKLSSHAFEFIDMGTRQIRGKREPVQCYELIGPKQERHNRRGLAGRDLPLIGRERELALLWERLQLTLQDQGQVVAVVGEAGVGKSSLLREFKRRMIAYDPDIWYLDGSAFSYSSGQYFSLMRTVLFKYCRISDNEEPAEMRRKLLLSIRELTGEHNELDGPEYGETAALLGQVAGLNLPNSFIDSLDPQRRLNLLVETLSDFFLSKAHTNPLALVLDDLHWVDANSLKVVERIVGRVLHRPATGDGRSGLPVMLLLLHRPDFEHTWPVPAAATGSFARVELERLTPDQMQPLVRQFLDEWLKSQAQVQTQAQLPARPAEAYAPVPAPVMAIVERAGGNAFFAEELLKRLLEDGYLQPDETEESGWRIVRDLDEFRPPESLQEILLARVDNLPVFDKRVLQVAAVVGNRFEPRVLLAVDDLAAYPQAVNQAIGTLQNKDLIALERNGSEVDSEYTFRHYLTREVAYNNLLGVERSRYHGQVARAIEHFKADRLGDYTVIDDLAYHYERSADEEKAVEYLVLAGDMRQNLFRNDEALKAFYEALEILQGAEFQDRPDTRDRLVKIASHIGDILALKEEYAEAAEHYNDALDRCDDPVSRIALLAKIIELHGRTGAYDAALQAYDQAVEEFDRLPDAALDQDHKTQHLRAKLLNQIGWIYYRQGRYDDARQAYQVSISLLEAADTLNRELQVDRGKAYNGLGQVYGEKGELALSEEYLQRAALLHQQTGKLDALGRTYNGLGWIEVVKGDFVKAEHYLKLSRDNAQRSGDVATAAASLGSLGIIAARQGRLELALRYYRSLENSPNPAFQANAWLNSGQVLLQQSRFEEARSALEQGIEQASRLGVPALVAEGYNNMGWLYLNSHDWERAAYWLNEGLRISLEINNPELAGYARLYRCELYLDQAELDLAQAEIEAATVLLAELGDPLMVGQLERHKGRLAFLQGDYNAAPQAFEKSLGYLEPIKAFLEMSYTKLYYARVLLAAYRLTADPETLDYARALLMQSVSTFEACEAVHKLAEAEDLLEELAPQVAV